MGPGSCGRLCPNVIQREDFANAVSDRKKQLNNLVKILLFDFYNLVNNELTNNSYQIGHIYPNYIHFKVHHPIDEKFIDGNFTALQRERGDLIYQFGCPITGA